MTVYRSIRGYHNRNRDKRLFQQYLRSSDVFIVGHPKSGNTWLTYMLATALNRDFEHRVTLANLKKFVPFIHGDDGKIGHFPQLPDPRIFRNENPVFPELYPKTIYLIRDPRAVLVSYYHHYRTVTNDSKMTLQGFVEEYLLYGFIRDFDTHSSRWDKQVLEWIRRRKTDDRIIIVKYEEMMQDRQNVLKRVIEFANLPCTDEEIALAAGRGSFEAMRTDEKQHGAESYPGEIGKRGHFIRRGKADAWEEEMSPHLVKQIENEFGQAMTEACYL